MQAREPAVKVATLDQAELVVDALVLAFAADPVTRFAFPEPTQHRAGFGQLVLAMGGGALSHGTALVTEGGAGVALWLPPGVGPDEAALAGIAERWVPAERRATVLAFMEEMGRAHPDEPHWYLPLIGVDAAFQGWGLGSTLLRNILDRCDRERIPAYLEATTPRNIALYERHGFRCLEPLRVNTCPPITPMWRRPGVTSR